MKILIVDDNKNNRMILRLLLEDHETVTKQSFDIKEVEDGVLAVEAAKKEHYDLIFMDIMMPNMDGIEATQLIREVDKKVMIIAVSAVDDSERKKVILSHGAEDYISKPVNSDLFNARLENYLVLIKNRAKAVKSVNSSYNLYEDSVNSYNVHFFGNEEEMFSEFWEFYLLNDLPYDGLSDMVRFVYSLGLEMADDNAADMEIFVEENIDTLYFNLISNKVFDTETVMLYADKNEFMDYKLKDKILTAKLTKYTNEDVAQPIVEEKPIVQEPTVQADNSVTYEASSKELHTFDILDHHDKIDLEEFISKLNSLLLVMGSSELESDEVTDLILAMGQIASALYSYNDFYNISVALNNLSKDIDSHRETFMAQSLSMGPLAKAFGGDLSRWFQSLFISGAPSIDFLDDSIISNAKMITSFIAPVEENSADEAVDDIFDF